MRLTDSLHRLSVHGRRAACVLAAALAVACGAGTDPTAVGDSQGDDAFDGDDAPGDGGFGSDDVFESSRPGPPPRAPRDDVGDDDAADDDALEDDIGVELPSLGTPADDEPRSPEHAIQEADLIELEGDRLYALSVDGGLSVIDVSEPSALRLLGRHKLRATPFAMVVEDGNALVLYNGVGAYEFDEATERWRWVQTSTVVAVDARAPEAIFERGRFPIAGTIVDSRSVGDVLYVVAFEDGSCWGCDDEPRIHLLSLDVSRPSAIEQVDALSFEEREGPRGWKKGLLMSTDERLYIASPVWGANDEAEGSVVRVVDVSDPAGRMVLGDSVQVEGQIESRWQLDEHEGVLRVLSQPFESDDGRAPVVETFAIESSQSIVPLGSLDLVLPPPGQLQSVRFDGARAYVVTVEQDHPIFALDLSNPAEPVQRGELELPGSSYHLHPHGDRLLAFGFDSGNADGALNVSLFDTTELDRPRLLERVDFGAPWSSLWAAQHPIHQAFRVLDDENLILVPFSGWDDAETEDRCSVRNHESGVQLIDWDDATDRLEVRGLAPAKGWARRGFFHRDALFTLSDDRLGAFDVSDRDEPRALDEVALARKVYEVAGSPEALVTVGWDWWSGAPEVTLSALSAPVSWLDTSEVELDDIQLRDCYGWAYMNEVRTSRDAVYLRYYANSYDEDQQPQGDTRVVTLDISDPEAPRVVADASLGFEPDGGYERSDVPGLVRSGQGLVHTGSTHVVSLHEYDYDDGYPESERRSVRVVDLSRPDEPLVVEVELSEGLGSTGLVVDGDIVATSHFEPSPTDPQRVRFFLDRIDVSDPKRPELLEPVNVPGALLVYDRQAERAIVLDYHSTDAEMMAKDCARKKASWFEFPEGTTEYDPEAIGTCHTVRQTLRVVAIEGRRASVVDSHRLAKGKHIQKFALGDDRLFLASFDDDVPDVTIDGDHARSFVAGSADLVVLSGLRSGELTATNLTLATGDTHGLKDLVAVGKRAVMAAGWRGRVTVVDASDPEAPRVTEEVPVGGDVQQLTVIGDRAVVALDDDGVQAIEFD